ncbi:hypothetical protein DMI62_10760 [Escherichia coli]|nr:hypothetical protein [Escherichia coli]
MGWYFAIGLLVDDAIVVVENVERVMMEDSSPEKRRKIDVVKSVARWWYRDGAKSAVFIPMAFFGGSTGQFIDSSSSLLFQQWRFQYWLR